MIELVSKDKCSGCYACYNACNIGAVTMDTDKSGFWFPQIDTTKCIECSACVNACPAIEKAEYQSPDPKAFIIQNKDDEIRRQSTSGGAFTGIALQTINKNGVVFGAAIDSDYTVSHIFVDNADGLARFRSSKYVQSKINNSYREAERILKTGREVCFSGTPCQIYGLKKYLGKDYDNLVTVDFMCRAVPSPKVLNKYLDYQKSKYPGFDRIVFRDKSRGYSYSGVALFDGDKIVYRGGSEIDPWLRLFLGGYCNRESCYECKYQNGVRASDITLWDCWGTGAYVPEWDDNKGTTNAIAWTQKGLEALKCDQYFRYKDIGIDNIDANIYRTKPLHKPDYDRIKFFNDCDTLPSTELISKYAPVTFKIRMKSFIRRSMYVLHIHDAVRNSVHKKRKAKKTR